MTGPGSSPPLRSQISSVTEDGISVRGRDVANDLMGHVSFTEMLCLAIVGRIPTEAERTIVDAVLVSLTEHGVTTSVAAARMTYWAAPEALQGAVAAGLLSAGSRVLGSMENCGKMLADGLTAADEGIGVQEAARLAVERCVERGEPVPGIGHTLHRGGDPRALRLLHIAGELGYRGRYVELLDCIASETRRVTQRQLPVNVTGAISAVMLEVGFEWQVLRGFALISRAAGLVAHLGEEHARPMTPAFREALQRRA